MMFMETTWSDPTLLPAFGDVQRQAQAIYSENADYVRRTIERQATLLEDSLQADSLEESFDLQLAFWKIGLDDYYEHVGRISRLMTSVVSLGLR